MRERGKAKEGLHDHMAADSGERTEADGKDLEQHSSHGKGPTEVEVGGMVASWLVRFTPERVVRVQAMAEDIVLCS